MFNMFSKQSRIDREIKTVETMITMYCHDLHSSNNKLCDDCQQLLDYARERLEKCPFREEKPTCAKCPIHCYKPEMREKVRSVMRYAGPRMAYRHPVQAIRHLVNGRKKELPNPRQMV
ncbi:MAG: nitrous oxide-stimulated promoter family protein [Chloroflexi bacterium]|nr:nitrous oxide-stimulated promoter family protein [Chloroflexota bacterium]